MKLSNELKTGASVLAAFAMLLLVLYQTGDLNYGKKGFVVKTRFGAAAGVKRFAPVRLSGVEVGEVRDIRLLYEPDRTVVEADLWVESGVKMRKDSLAGVATLGLMGEKYVEIRAGSSGEFLAPGELIEGRDPVDMDQLIRTLQGVGEEVNKTLKEFRGFIGNTNEIVAGNRSKIDAIIDNLEEASEYARDFTEDIKYNPWKVLSKGKEKTPEEIAQLRAERRAKKRGGMTFPKEGTVMEGAAAQGAPSATGGPKSNFAVKR